MQIIDPSKVLVREFDFSTGTLKLYYDPDSTTSDSVLIDTSGPIRLTLDETHALHAIFSDFLAVARRTPQAPLPAEPGALNP